LKNYSYWSKIAPDGRKSRFFQQKEEIKKSWKAKNFTGLCRGKGIFSELQGQPEIFRGLIPTRLKIGRCCQGFGFRSGALRRPHCSPLLQRKGQLGMGFAAQQKALQVPRAGWTSAVALSKARNY
jgi:hypothetical protein